MNMQSSELQERTETRPNELESSWKRGDLMNIKPKHEQSSSNISNFEVKVMREYISII